MSCLVHKLSVKLKYREYFSDRLFMKRFVEITFLVLISISAFALNEAYFGKSEYDVPKRELSVIATTNGYFPSDITAFVGEKLSLYVTSSSDRPSCLILKEHEVYLEAKKGQVREASMFLDTPGRFKFYCPSGEISGTLTVIDHPRQQAKRKKREIASRLSEKVQVWRPRDE